MGVWRGGLKIPQSPRPHKNKEGGSGKLSPYDFQLHWALILTFQQKNQFQQANRTGLDLVTQDTTLLCHSSDKVIFFLSADDTTVYYSADP